MTYVRPIQAQNEVFMRDSVDLWSRQREGHAGRWTYTDAKLWADFVEHNPFYHVFNEECALFALHADDFANGAREIKRAVDFGRGSPLAFERKPLAVLARIPNLEELVSVDICGQFPKVSLELVKRWIPKLDVQSMQVDFYRELPVFDRPVLAFFVGSTISNLVLQQNESLKEGITRVLNHFASALPKGSLLLFSYDSCQDPSQLARMYNHPSFNRLELSIVDRMVKELGLKGISSQDFVPDYAWDPERHLWALKIKLTRQAKIKLGEFETELQEGESFWTGSCYKCPDKTINDALKETPLRSILKAEGPNVRLMMALKA